MKLKREERLLILFHNLLKGEKIKAAELLAVVEGSGWKYWNQVVW